MTRRNSFLTGGLVVFALVLVFWLAQSGIGQTKACYVCGKIVQDYVEVSAAPKSANVVNTAIARDDDAQNSASVHYTFCNDCFETLQGCTYKK